MLATILPIELEVYQNREVRKNEPSQLEQTIKKMRKCELHTHLTGCYPKKFLKKIATDQNKLAAYAKFKEELNKIKGRIDYDKCFYIFKHIEEIMGLNRPCETPEELAQVRQNIIDGTIAVIKEYADDNVGYLELRTSLKRLEANGNFKPYLDAVLKGIKKGCKLYDIEVYLLLSLRRNTDPKSCQETVDLAIEHKYPKGKVVGMDLSGNSLDYGDVVDLDKVPAVEELKRAGKNHLPIAIHIGESDQETEERQLYEIKHLRPSRIGHGVNLCMQALALVIEFLIPIEICPWSAFFTSMFKNLENDANPRYAEVKKGHPAIFGTDDTTMFFGTTVSEQVYTAALALGWNEEQVAENQQLAMNHSFKAIMERSIG